MSRVFIRECAGYGQPLVAGVLDGLLDAASLRVEGKRVLVKPNMLGLYPPAKGVTTHPVFVSCAVEAMRRRGAAGVIVGDNPGIGGYSMNERAGRVTGIAPAAGEAYRNISRGGVRVPTARLPVTVSREALDAQVVVSLPRFKTHILTGITGAIKNMFGIVAGGDKVGAHWRVPDRDGFSAFMADVCAVRPPDLTILDGVVVMEGTGPSQGRLRPAGRVLASTDPVALDTVMARMAGIDPGCLAMLARGAELGLGRAEGFEVDGDASPLPRFRLPVTMRLPRGVLGDAFHRMGCWVMSRRAPVLARKRCDGCGICAAQCPAGALAMEEGAPAIDRGKCIRCFCCNELCPRGAWAVKVKF